METMLWHKAPGAAPWFPKDPFMTTPSLFLPFSAAIQHLLVPRVASPSIWVLHSVFVLPVVLWRRAVQLWFTWRGYGGSNWCFRVCDGARNGVI